MSSARIRVQLKTNLVAIISLVVALTALGYTTWRNERTEYNRNVRVAAFETLKQLGEAQIIVEYAHFQKNRQLGDPLQGWGRMIYIRDLAKLLPASAPADAERLRARAVAGDRGARHGLLAHAGGELLPRHAAGGARASRTPGRPEDSRTGLGPFGSRSS